MAESNIQICNMALGHLGHADTIANLDSERTTAAIACRMFYEMALKATLRDAPWPFATRVLALGLVTEKDVDDAHPTDEWVYSYRYPSNCLYFRKIQSGTRNDTQATRTPYKIASDDDGQLIFTDREDSVGEWTAYVTNTNTYPPDFDLAFSLRLAHLIAPMLTGADPYKVGERARQLYMVEISKADAAGYNEEQFERVPDSEFITARE